MQNEVTVGFCVFLQSDIHGERLEEVPQGGEIENRRLVDLRAEANG